MPSKKVVPTRPMVAADPIPDLLRQAVELQRQLADTIDVLIGMLPGPGGGGGRRAPAMRSVPPVKDRRAS